MPLLLLYAIFYGYPHRLWADSVVASWNTGSFEKFVDWRHCAAIRQRVAVTIMSSYSGEANAVVTW